jgi:hypothetical protein
VVETERGGGAIVGYGEARETGFLEERLLVPSSKGLSNLNLTIQGIFEISYISDIEITGHLSL